MSQSEAVATPLVLLAEADGLRTQSLVAALAGHGVTAEWLRSIQDAQRRLTLQRFDALLLAIELLDPDPLATLRQLRVTCVVPAVHVIGHTLNPDQQVAVIDAGADDVLLRPLNVALVAARLRAAWRRQVGTPARLRVGPLELDLSARRANWRGVPVDLSSREYALLLVLAHNRGRVLSRRRLEDALYGWSGPIGSNAVEVHVHHVRRKTDPRLIRTIRSEGYVID